MGVVCDTTPRQLTPTTSVTTIYKTSKQTDSTASREDLNFAVKFSGEIQPPFMSNLKPSFSLNQGAYLV